MDQINLEKPVSLKQAAKEVYKQVKLNLTTEAIGIGGFLLISLLAYYPNKTILLGATAVLCGVIIFFLRKDYNYKLYLEKKYQLK